MTKLFIILFLVAFQLQAQITPGQVTTQMIKNRVDNLIELIIEEQQPDGSWNYSGHTAGATALHLLALSTAGLTDKHPAVQKGIAYLMANFPNNDTYSVGMYACAFQALDQAKYKNEISKAATWLIDHQVEGTWNYSGNASGGKITENLLAPLSLVESDLTAIAERIHKEMDNVGGFLRSAA